jgi:diguanylate cyclase (GGDEF)-like protein/PAS domain S-box-containing protein
MDLPSSMRIGEFQSLRVMLVDADDGNAERIVAALRASTFRVEYTQVRRLADLQAGLNVGRWDVLLTDAVLPGFDVLDVLHELDRRGLDLPLIVVTDALGERRAVQIMAAGAQDVISREELSRLVAVVEREAREAAQRAARREAEARLVAAEAEYRSLVELLPSVIWRWPINVVGPPTYVSPQVEMITGYSREQWLRGEIIWLDRVHPDDRPVAMEADERLVCDRTPYSIEYRFYRADGSIAWMHDHMASVMPPDGGTPYLQGVLIDVTQAHLTEALLEESETRYRMVVETSHDAIVFASPDGIIQSANATAARMFGYPSQAVMEGLDALELIVPEQRDEVRGMVGEIVRTGEPGSSEVLSRRSNGSSFPAESTTNLLVDATGQPVALVTILRDITERRAHEDALRHQALHDFLTGLPNRVLFSDRVEQAVRSASRDGANLALLLIDLDGFKEVNDTLGHHVGDEVLKLVGERLAATLRQSDTVARLGGDEFAILLSGVDLPGAVATAEKLLSMLSEPTRFDDHSLYVGCSIGIVVFPEHGEDMSTLLRRADVAMYTAKRRGGGCRAYAPEADPHSTRRLDLIAGLRRAVEESTLTLHYQPKIDLRNGMVREVEALVRWTHPEHGAIPPDQFIPIAEQTGLIRPLTLWVVSTAAKQIQAWQDVGVRVRVAVNLSTWNLHDPNFPDALNLIITTCGCDPRLLLLEITESAIMVDPDRALETVRGLHAMGISISIDDFGTGYSSLAYLQRLPVDEVKIDRSFVRDMTAAGSGSAIIVRSVIDLGHNLGMQVVAEGVETGDQAGMLHLLGCDAAQGYLFSRPLPPVDLGAWLARWKPSSVISRQ